MRGIAETAVVPAAKPSNRRRCSFITSTHGVMELLDQFDVMFANLITLPHFSISLAISLPNSAGVIGIGMPPRSAMPEAILASARAALISALSLATISGGVFFGAATPCQAKAS